MSVGETLQHEQVRLLYREHHGWLHGWIRKKLGCTHNAADLAQDTFTRILASRSTPPDIREPRAYLVTVARGLMLNWRKRRVLERAYLDALADMPAVNVPPPEQRMLILEALHEIDAMLDSLPARVRHAFLLSQLEGMKYEDIARQMRVSLITVKRYMKQAFRQCLAASLLNKLGSVPASLAMRVLDRPADLGRRDVAIKLAIVLGLGAAGWAGTSVVSRRGWTADHRTGIGERRDIELSDRTRITLNTSTAIDVRFDSGQRLVKLRAGEMLVETGRDDRPFRVRTAHGHLRPLGTRFNVRMDDDFTRLAVFEGAVRIELAGGTSSVVESGSQAWFSESAIGAVTPVDDGAAAWTAGMLIADRMRLADLARELARYRSGLVRCDPDVADVKVSGAFPIADTERTLAMIRATYPVDVDTRTSFWVTLRRR